MYIVTLYVNPYVAEEMFATDNLTETLQWLRSRNFNHWLISRTADNVVIAQQAHHIVKSID